MIPEKIQLDILNEFKNKEKYMREVMLLLEGGLFLLTYVYVPFMNTNQHLLYALASGCNL